MKLEKKIKEKLNHELPYSPCYDDFAKSANIEAKARKHPPVYRSVRQKVIAASLTSVVAIGAIAAIVPTVIIPAISGQNSVTDDIPYLRYRPINHARNAEISNETAKIYGAFVEKATTSFFSLEEYKDISSCIYLPDLFFSCAMLATISDEAIQNSYLEAIGAESINQLKAASGELTSYLVFLDKADEAGEADYGSFNLNGFFYDSSAKLKEGHDSYLQDFSDHYNSYSFSSRPSKNIVDAWREKEDEEGYLEESTVSDYSDCSVISTLSSAALFDAFPHVQKIKYLEAYEFENDVAEYYLGDEVLQTHYLHLEESDESISQGDDFQMLRASINKTTIKAYLPSEGLDVDDFAPTIFQKEATGSVSLANLELHIPMFTIEKPITLTAEKLFAFFAGEGLANKFINDSNVVCSISQSNALTLDYNGFKGNSIAPAKPSITSPSNDPYVAIERPFVFSVSYGDIDLYYGKVHNPGYPYRVEDTVVS